MLFALVIALSAAPPPALPGEIMAPLGHVGNVVDAPPKGGVSESDRVVVPQWDGCEAKGVYLMRFLSGSSRALEQVQSALDRVPGTEKTLFGKKKGVLTEVMRQLSSSKFEAKVPCEPSPRVDGYKLELSGLPKKWCDAKPDAQDGEFWFFANGKPAAVISVQKGASDPCKPRLSTVLFDAKGLGRLRLHADWGGAIETFVAGEKCQALEYTLNAEKQAFVPTWKSCKR
jgi:hypothetical protein